MYWKHKSLFKQPSRDFFPLPSSGFLRCPTHSQLSWFDIPCQVKVGRKNNRMKGWGTGKAKETQQGKPKAWNDEREEQNCGAQGCQQEQKAEYEQLAGKGRKLEDRKRLERKTKKWEWKNKMNNTAGGCINRVNNLFRIELGSVLLRCKARHHLNTQSSPSQTRSCRQDPQSRPSDKLPSGRGREHTIQHAMHIRSIAMGKLFNFPTADTQKINFLKKKSKNSKIYKVHKLFWCSSQWFANIRASK